jgi:hypothetical protein
MWFFFFAFIYFYCSHYYPVKNIYEKNGREGIRVNTETCLLLEERVA